MQRRTLLVLTAALLGSAALTPVTASAAAPPTCSQLAALLASQPYITVTASDNEGIASPQAAIMAGTTTTASYCHVQFQLSSQSGPTYGYAVGESQTIGIGIGLPLNSTDGGVPTAPNGFTWTAVNGAWNGKVQNLGGGGCSGSVGSVTGATNYGWVGSSTDTGHNNTAAQNGTDCNFGLIASPPSLDYGKINDFIYEGIHQQYVWAKWLADKYYGTPAVRNYWNGCSTGGRQGLALAEHFGSDFDGFLIGAPAIYWQEFRTEDSWLGLLNADYNTALTTGQLAAASSGAIAACDVMGTDTVADGVIDDPRACNWSASNKFAGRRMHRPRPTASPLSRRKSSTWRGTVH